MFCSNEEEIPRQFRRGHVQNGVYISAINLAEMLMGYSTPW